MQDNFTKARQQVFIYAGGYQEYNPLQRVATMRGIPLDVYQEYCDEEYTTKTDEDLRCMSGAAIERIYEGYWDACWCVYLPTGADYLTLDNAVTFGVARASGWLYDALHETGWFGKSATSFYEQLRKMEGIEETLATVALIQKLCEVRRAHLELFGAGDEDGDNEYEDGGPDERDLHSVYRVHFAALQMLFPHVPAQTMMDFELEIQRLKALKRVHEISDNGNTYGKVDLSHDDFPAFGMPAGMGKADALSPKIQAGLRQVIEALEEAMGGVGAWRSLHETGVSVCGQVESKLRDVIFSLHMLRDTLSD